jgi:hypothetical protein
VEKYRNFHGCPLEYRRGYEKLYSVFGNALNFTLEYKKRHLTINDTVMFSIGYYYGNMMDDMIPFVTAFESRKIYIPPGEIYGDYEKMLLPFDKSTWIAIAVTIIMGILGILIIKRLTARIQERFFGANNRSPLMNFIEILINGCQHTNLVQNAPRFFLLNFMILSLIIRTCYQSKAFENLQQLKRKPMKTTLESLSEANFTMQTFFYNDCPNINMIATERGLPK